MKTAKLMKMMFFLIFDDNLEDLFFKQKEFKYFLFYLSDNFLLSLN